MSETLVFFIVAPIARVEFLDYCLCRTFLHILTIWHCFYMRSKI
jgi:hypothetical protein